MWNVNEPYNWLETDHRPMKMARLPSPHSRIVNSDIHYSWIMRPQCCLPTSFAVTPYLHNTLRWNNILTAHWSCEEKSPAIDGVKIWIGPLGLVSGCMRACFIHGCSVQNRKWDWISASDLNHWPWDCPVCDFQSKIPSSPVTGRERETITSFEN